MQHSRSILILLLATALQTGCTKYPQVEFENLQYVAALRTACSAQNTEWLQQTRQAIESERSANRIGDDEYEAYQSILAKAESGAWRDAEMECVRFQKDQLAR